MRKAKTKTKTPHAARPWRPEPVKHIHPDRLCPLAVDLTLADLKAAKVQTSLLRLEDEISDVRRRLALASTRLEDLAGIYTTPPKPSPATSQRIRPQSSVLRRII
jgi:hypothetical protein